MLNQASCHEDLWGSGSVAFLTSAVKGNEWSASSPGCLNPGAHWIGSKGTFCPEDFGYCQFHIVTSVPLYCPTEASTSSTGDAL